MQISFTPTLAPMPRGILATCSAKVAPGTTTTQVRAAYAEAYDVEMPLTDAVHRVCHEGLSVPDAVHSLLGRRHKPE